MEVKKTNQLNLIKMKKNNWFVILFSIVTIYLIIGIVFFFGGFYGSFAKDFSLPVITLSFLCVILGSETKEKNGNSLWKKIRLGIFNFLKTSWQKNKDFQKEVTRILYGGKKRHQKEGSFILERNPLKEL